MTSDARNHADPTAAAGDEPTDDDLVAFVAGLVELGALDAAEELDCVPGWTAWAAAATAHGVTALPAPPDVFTRWSAQADPAVAAAARPAVAAVHAHFGYPDPTTEQP